MILGCSPDRLPVRIYEALEFAEPHIAYFNMNDPRRRSGDDYSMGKVSVFRYDRMAVFSRVFPDIGIRPFCINVGNKQKLLALPNCNAAGQVRINEESLHVRTGSISKLFCIRLDAKERHA